MGLGDKAAALALTERAMAANPIEKDAMDGPSSIEILARVAAKMGEPDRAIAALQKLLSIPYAGAFAEGLPLTPALLRLDPMFDPLRNDPRFQKLCEETSQSESRMQLLRRAEAAQRFRDGGDSYARRVPGCLTQVASTSFRLSTFPAGSMADRSHSRRRFSLALIFSVGVRDDARGYQARRRRGARATDQAADRATRSTALIVMVAAVAA